MTKPEQPTLFIDAAVYTKPNSPEGLFKQTALRVQQGLLSLGDWFMQMPDYDLNSLMVVGYNITSENGDVSEQEAMICTTALANMASLLLVGQGENLTTQSAIHDAAIVLLKYIVLESGLRHKLSDVQLAAIRKRYSLDGFDNKLYEVYDANKSND